MPKVKLTKGELKAQREALKRFQRFLPTLQLKKQQLQLETRRSQERIKNNKQNEEEAKRHISSWLLMFGRDEDIGKLIDYINVKKIDYNYRNVAGVDIPVYNKVEFEIKDYNLFEESPWIDDAIRTLCRIIEIRAERDLLKEQYDKLNKELLTTTQRVNLFEKVKIPECKENIRTIQIYLDDQQTAQVARSKIAKKKLTEASR